MAYKESQSQIDTFQQAVDGILISNYLTKDTADLFYTAYSGLTQDANFGNVYSLIIAVIKAYNSSGLCLSNSTGGVVLKLGESNGRNAMFYGNILPDQTATRDLGTNTTTNNVFQTLYLSKGIGINPTVNVALRSLIDIISRNSTDILQILQAASGQTSNLLETRDSSAAVMSKISSSGHFLWSGQKRVTTQVDVASNTTLANVTQLAVNVAAGKTYTFEARLWLNTAASGGQKFAIGGTCTASLFFCKAIMVTGGAAGTASSLGSLVLSSTSGTTFDCVITGHVTVANAGTLVPMFAQGASLATASSIKVNSTFIVNQID